MPLTTYCHQQSKTPSKMLKGKGGGNDSVQKSKALGKSTQRLKKTNKKVSKSLFKAAVATELFRSPTATPVKTPNQQRRSFADPESTRQSARKMDFMEYLDDGVILSPTNKQLGQKNSVVLELRTKKQTKAAKAKRRKNVKASRTPKKKATSKKMLPRTPAREPKVQKPLQSTSKGETGTKQNAQKEAVMKFFAGAGRVVACLAPFLFAAVKSRKLATA